MTVLEVRNLSVHVRTPAGVARAVDKVDLRVGEGEAVGLVGESGSGKTVLALSILGLQPGGRESVQPGSSIRFRGKELVGAGPAQLRGVRGGQVAMVFQEPMTALNPTSTVGSQVRECVELHGGLTGGKAQERTVRLLREVGIPDPDRRIREYPHRLSGGMRQRVMLAMALAGDPALLIADEPTTALDVTTEAQIIRLLRETQTRLGMALLLISHDPGLVARVCSRLVVLYGGRVMETGSTREILESPKHPYTRGLLGSRLSVSDRRKTLRPIPGEIPEATDWPRACRFHPRCPDARVRCRLDEPSLLQLPGETTGPRDLSVSENSPRSIRCWLFAAEEEGR